MSEKNASYGSDFSRVFRHELASIRDRRRSQRIESLQQLSEAGDYSRRAVKWAINAAKQEADMAKQVADAAKRTEWLVSCTYWAYQLLQTGEEPGDGSTRAKVIEELRKAIQRFGAPEVGTTDRTTGDADADKAAVCAEDDGGSVPGEYAPVLKKKLEEIAAGLMTSAADRRALATAASELIDRIQQIFRDAPPSREPSRAASGTLEAVQKKAEASRAAQERALAASSQTSKLGKKIIKAAAINTVAERVASIHAIMDLLKAASDTAQEVTASETTEAAKAAYDALDRALGRIRHEEVGLIPKEIQELHAGLERFSDEIPPQQPASPPEETGDLQQKLVKADETCGTVCGTTFAELSTELTKGNQDDRLAEKLPELNDEAKQDLVKGHVEQVKPIVKAAIEQLSKRAVEAAGWAWRAEQEAAETLDQAAAVLKQLQPSADAPKTSGEADAPQPVLAVSPLPEEPALENLREQAVNLELAGLAFSGGGIRSATFNLGVLQALGQLRLLHSFDYLSTVSGGGYIGGWLAAWVQRELSLSNVEKQLDPSRVTQADAKRVVKKFEEKINDPPPDEPPNPSHRLQPVAIDEEPEPIHHLRAFSRYLTPRPGIFSADTWAFFAIYLRNLLINLAVLLPWVLAAVLLSRLLIWLFAIPDDLLSAGDNWVVSLVFLGSTACLGVWLYGERTRVQEAAESPDAHPEGADSVKSGRGKLLLLGVMLMTIASLWLFSIAPPSDEHVVRLRGDAAQQYPLRHPGYSWLNNESPIADWPALGKFALGYALGGVILSLTASLLTRALYSSGGHSWKLLGWDVCLAVGLGLFLSLALFAVVWPLGTDAAAVVTFGVPALLLALILADYTEILFVGKWMDELEREWRSRLGAVLFMLAAGWLLFFGATLYLPWALEQIADDPKRRAAIFSTAAAAWGSLSALGGWAGRWLQAGKATRRSLPWLRLLILIGPPVFLIGLLAVVAMLIPLLPPYPAEGILPPQGTRDPLNIACDPTALAGLKWSTYLLVAFFFMSLFSLIVDVNRNSMHMFYANRLIRCYLGASRRKRQWRRRVAGPIDSFWQWKTGDGGAPTNADAKGKRIARREPTFSGFDPADDMWLQDLAAVGPKAPAADAPAQPDKGYRGPYPLFNTTLNLVAGNELALQDRKADSFVLTPDFCGSKITGYARLPGKENFSDKGHLTLGRAMTISGAAVDPNMGVGQSPPLTALMTVLNTRLGWWLQNPACWGNRWEGSGPTAGALLIRELFGLTDAKSKYVHLSDGGHFENLGVYELIRRRCRFIVVTDVTPDHHAASDNLGNLLRLIRTDFGIRIDLDTGALAEGADGSTRWHCAIGLIHYEDVDPQSLSGLLIYLRASLSGDEPPDVRQYADTCPPFPHQSTLDQFYSEGQLESYRALGYHVASEVFAASAKIMNRDGCDPQTVQAEVRDFFARVRRRWFPSPPRSDQNFPKTAQLHVDVDKKLRTEESLQHLCRELYPELRDASPTLARPPLFAPPVGRATPALVSANADASPELFMTAEMLQMMEMVWFDMKLDDFYAHPLNRGWMNLFRRWTNSATFHGYWPLLRSEFSQDFVLFCERALNMRPIKSHCERLKKTDVAKWLSELKEMDREFLNEWDSERDRLPWLPTGRYLRDAVANASSFVDRFNPKKEPTDRSKPEIHPLVWRLSFTFGQNESQRRTCGLICAGPAFRGAAEQLELIVWLRGPYRSLGIGRHRFGEILSKIGEELGGKPARNGLPFRLYVYYPDAGVNRAERLEQLMWRNFFFDYEFRAVKETDAGSLAGVITLARELG